MACAPSPNPPVHGQCDAIGRVVGALAADLPTWTSPATPTETHPMVSWLARQEGQLQRHTITTVNQQPRF